MKDTDRFYMLNAIELAKCSGGAVNPNPQVGAIIVKNDKIIGRGYHMAYGQLHAERNALASCTEDPGGATIYVTLEPCCHYGKTPPCTAAIIESKLARVVIGSRDPNPLVSGKGTEILRAAGIEVTEDFLKEECDELNKRFFHYITTKTPYVTMKYAMTCDGKIATFSGKSKWITSDKTREQTHYDRDKNMGIMVGLGTVLADNPLLTTRIDGGISPIRIILDSNLNTPLDCDMVKTANETGEKLRQPRTIIATTVTNSSKINPYIEKGVRILSIKPDNSNKVDLKELVSKLGELGIDSILLEGGGELNWAALKAGIVNKVQAYIAPKIFGGKLAKGPVSGEGVENPQECYKLTNSIIKTIGDDFLIESEVKNCSQE